MVVFDLIYAAVKQQKKTKKILTIKLNNYYLSSNLVIEFHAGGARFEITTAVLLFVVKNDIKTLFFWKQARTASKSGCTLYAGKHIIQSIF